MQEMSSLWQQSITAPSRILNARVDVLRDSTLVYSIYPEDFLASIKIERLVEEGRAFGYTICQKATVEILDAAETPFDFKIDDILSIKMGTATELATNPHFYIDEITRDEVKKKITIVAYDIINKSSKHTWNEVAMVYEPGQTYTVREFLLRIADVLGVEYVINGSFTGLAYSTEKAPNLDGTETLREVLGDLAESMGMICFMDSANKLCFKKLDSSAIVASIDKSDYFELKLGTSETFTEVIQTNELEDVSAVDGNKEGRVFIIRSNPFLDNRNDTGPVINALATQLNTQPFTAYNIKWRGNPAFDIGDCIKLTKEDETFINIFYLGETLTYNGGLVAKSEWKFTDEDSIETPPQTIGDAIKKTYAKVDKVNREISLVASEIGNNQEDISAIKITTDNINASVSQLQENIEQDKEATSQQLLDIKNQVDMAVTAEDLTIRVQEEISNGVDRVTTATGFTFDEVGLTVEKDGSQMKTQITEDGMKVFRDDTAVLVADNSGVEAHNLHAENFLIIATYSRLEDYTNERGEPRTGCFWLR